VKAQIKICRSADVRDLEAWKPASREIVYFPLELNIGPEGEETSEIFQIVVATPEALRYHHGPDFALWARHYLIVMDYNWELLNRVIAERVGQCEGENWADIAQQLARYFHWEYEDIKMESFDPNEIDDDELARLEAEFDLDDPQPAPPGEWRGLDGAPYSDRG
jgi:hypothetical protein